MEALGRPRPDAPFDHVYGTPCEEVEAQRAELLASIAREETLG